jgi:H+/Cl- antiporter ClcA
MSLPGSQRAVGTDGNDFQHRERIAPHYRVSTETKSRLRLLIYLHFLFASVVLLQLITYHIPLITKVNIPRPHLWQYIWLIGIFSSICGLLSLHKNHISLMKIFFYGTIIFGLGTIMITIILNLSELFTFKKLKTNHQLDEVEPQTFLGLPLLVLWYIFLIITVQIHAYSLYMANVLLRSWQQYRSAKHN